jgi:tRNA threonylcarbamoyladenosine biosynthesis protein TsaB
MKILGIDTTTKFLILGIYNNEKIYEYNLEVGIRLSSLLAQTIKRVLDDLGWHIYDIDYFACGLGPGSFTGIRVGLATIKGLAFSLNKPIVGISTLDILASNARITNGCVVPIIDAKRSLIYCSFYKIKEGASRRITPYMLLTLEEFLKSFKNLKQTEILGDAVSLYKEKILRNIKGTTILDKDYWYPKAHNIIQLAKEKIKAKRFDNPFKIKPIYLYPKECQIRKCKT